MGKSLLHAPVALLALEFEQDLADDFVSLATDSIPDDDAAFLRSPSVTDVAKEVDFGRIRRCVPGPLGRRRSQFGRFHRPQVIVNGPERTEEPGECALPEGLQVTAIKYDKILVNCSITLIK